MIVIQKIGHHVHKSAEIFNTAFTRAFTSPTLPTTTKSEDFSAVVSIFRIPTGKQY